MVVTDIVERLRSAATPPENGPWGKGDDELMMDEAADEIERLRAEVAQWQAKAEIELLGKNNRQAEIERLRGEKFIFATEIERLRGERASLWLRLRAITNDMENYTK